MAAKKVDNKTGIGKSVGAAKSAILRALRAGYAEPTVGIQVSVSDRNAIREYAKVRGISIVKAVNDLLLRSRVVSADVVPFADKCGTSSRSGRVTDIISRIRKRVDPHNNLDDAELAELIRSGSVDADIKRVYETLA